MANDDIYVDINGKRYGVKVITTFNMLGNDYCVYAIPNSSHNNSVYCDRLIDNALIAITDEQELKVINNVVQKLLEPLKKANL